MTDKSLLDTLPEDTQKDSGPVTCLGHTFENDEARRAHFTEELRQKLQDTEFRKIEGFPIGTDEAILNLSDPPYYTACPNPWLADFIAQWEAEKPEKPADYTYHREPFAADVSEGKNDPIYNAHSYHTKVPHKAIMRYILHYTEPGDIVFDGFCGTGMTGVAAQMCGDRDTVTSLGYQVKPDGTILREEENEEGKKVWIPFSKLGVRKAVLNDLSPAATFIAYNYNTPVDVHEFEREAGRILVEVEEECGWMYETQHTDGRIGKINYTVWSEINTCSHCGKDFVFYLIAYDQSSSKLLANIYCQQCKASLEKGFLGVVYESVFDEKLEAVIKRPKRVPVLINYSVNGKRYIKTPEDSDILRLKKCDQTNLSASIPSSEIPDMQMMRVGRMQSSGVTHIHHFFLHRAAVILGTLWDNIDCVSQPKVKALLKFWFDSHLVNMSIRNRYRPDVSFPYNPLTGVFYVPSMVSEASVFQAYSNKLKRITTALKALKNHYCYAGQTCSSSARTLEENSIDYIFVDPPFGENIYYSDLNSFVEAWYHVFTNATKEAIIDKVRKKGVFDYQNLMRECFKDFYRVLKPGRWMTVEFSNSKASIWNSIQTTLQDVGFVVSNVSALDKKQHSFQSVTSPTAVKQDLVISAYKPNGGFEERFIQKADNEEGVWEFIRTHLGYLPVTKMQGTTLQNIPERDPRILFDQMVAYYVRKGYQVPLSSQEFQLGLRQRFTEEDGMFFLPEQAADYRRKRHIAGSPQQGSLFVKDESSAIQWLTSFLKNKPQTYQDIHPHFLRELGGWSKNETQLELSTLLEQNFLKYDGKGAVPEQIHAYLSSNWKDQRNRAKNDPELQAKSKDRWYVPDPNKAGDLEQLREKALLKEFEEYKASTKKQLKPFRSEAVRAGFKKAWQEHDYATIVAIAKKIPSSDLEEDPKLLMWYDQALTRMGDA